MSEHIEFLSQRKFLWPAALSIIALGTGLEIWIENDFLSRSGALVTMFALVILWVWLRIEEERKATEGAHDLAKSQYVNGKLPDASTLADTFQGSAPGLPSNYGVNVAKTLHLLDVDGKKLTGQLATVSRSLGFAQVEIALLGTFVWGFGNLLSPILANLFC